MFGATNGRKWPEMVQNWPCEAPPASDIDFRTKIVKVKLIPNKRLMLEIQSGPSWTMFGPEMAQTCPSGAPPVQDICPKIDI